jgi:predicted O-methyltransferase YrrM
MSKLPDPVAEIYDSKDGSFRSNIDREEAEFLISFVGAVGKLDRGIEVGFAYGVSAACICAAATSSNPDYQHTVIDPYQGRDYQYRGLQIVERSCTVSLALIEERSEYALPRLASTESASYDLAFIDGWHTFDSTFIDICFCLRLLKVGGYLIMDDCRMPPVAKAVNCVQTWPFVHTIAGSPNNSIAATRVLSNFAARALPPFVAQLLPMAVYRQLFPRARMSTMMVLQKIGNDDRHWNWHAEF